LEQYIPHLAKFAEGLEITDEGEIKNESEVKLIEKVENEMKNMKVEIVVQK